jgi:nucleotide-binding universal stress UspA family protein
MLEEEATLFTTPVEVRVVEGDPAPALAAEGERFGLVIVGTRGRSVVAGLLLGSVARYLLRAVARPVMVVHSPLTALGRVLVGVDPSPSSVAVVRTARAVADAAKASLVMLHAVDTDPDVMRRPEAFGISPEVWAGALEAHGEKVFRPLRAIAGEAEERLVFGPAVERIRHTAKAEGAELVVVGRRGSSGLDVDAWFSVAFALAARGPFATIVV